VGGCGGDPGYALCLRNAADFRLPTVAPDGTRLGHSWFEWIVKSDVVGWSDKLEKEDVSGHCEWIWGWPCGWAPHQECCRLSPTYFWATWHQTRAFLISLNIKSDVAGRFDNFEKGDVSGHFERLRGWSRGCTPPQECCRLPPTYFWTILHQTRVFLISVKNEKWCVWLVWQFRKRRRVWSFWVLAGLFHSASGMLHTTAYLLIDDMATN
jgi:hypothetical protein